MKTIAKLFKNESGATAIEYGLIIALISVAIIIAVEAVGKNSVTTYDTVNTALQ